MAKKMTATEALDGAIDHANATIIGLALAKTDPNVTLGELLDVFEEAGFRGELDSLSIRKIRELVQAPGKVGRPRKTGPSLAPMVETEAAVSKLPDATPRNTRTKEGRDALDTDVIAFLGGVTDPVQAQYVRGAVGGSPNQVRESLARLLDRKMVTKSGQARSTEYKMG